MCKLRQAWHTVVHDQLCKLPGGFCALACVQAPIPTGCSTHQFPAAGRVPASPLKGLSAIWHVGESRYCKRQGGTMHPRVAWSKNRKPMKELCEKQTWTWKPNLKDSFCGWSSILNVLQVQTLPWLTGGCSVSGTNGSVICIYMCKCTCSLRQETRKLDLMSLFIKKKIRSVPYC